MWFWKSAYKILVSNHWKAGNMLQMAIKHFLAGWRAGNIQNNFLWRNWQISEMRSLLIVLNRNINKGIIWLLLSKNYWRRKFREALVYIKYRAVSTLCQTSWRHQTGVSGVTALRQFCGKLNNLSAVRRCNQKCVRLWWLRAQNFYTFLHICTYANENATCSIVRPPCCLFACLFPSIIQPIWIIPGRQFSIAWEPRTLDLALKYFLICLSRLASSISTSV